VAAQGCRGRRWRRWKPVGGKGVEETGEEKEKKVLQSKGKV